MVGLEGLFYVVVTALIVGLILSVIVLFPILLVLDFFNANNYLILGGIGAVVGFLFFVFPPIEEPDQLVERWPLAVFFCVLGGGAGVISSYLLSKLSKRSPDETK